MNHIINRNIIWIVVLLVIVMIAVFWFLSTDKRKPTIISSITYDDMKAEFSSRPESFYLSNDRNMIEKELNNSNFEYEIIDSDGEVIFWNRRCDNTLIDQDSIDTFEVTQSIATKCEAFILRDRVRYAAFYVSDKKSRARVVHMSSMNARLNQVILSR